ncbi:MAG: S41 family peptidase [Candidatus Obscuribacterales bacterium]
MCRLSRQILYLSFLAALIIGVLIGPCFAAQTQPREIYHQVWMLVRDRYFDPNLNGVDWSSYEHKFDNRIKTVSDAKEYTSKMLAILDDPHTKVLEGKELASIRAAAMPQRIVGIGINLKSVNGEPAVIKTVEESPADKAGIRVGDTLVAVDGKSCAGFTPEKVAEMIRGSDGEPVKLSVKRAGAKEVLEFGMKRAQIAIRAVGLIALPDNHGYINIASLKPIDASREFKAAVLKLSKVEGLIIDLRKSQGENLPNALDISDMLLSRGSMCTTTTRRGRHTDLASGNPLIRLPIVVLIDQETSSSSEVLAGALKDNSRATLVGKPTRGDGLHAEQFDLAEDLTLVMATGLYSTPGGTIINKNGIKPDIIVENEPEKPLLESNQMKTAIEVLKKRIAK